MVNPPHWNPCLVVETLATWSKLVVLVRVNKKNAEPNRTEYENLTEDYRTEHTSPLLYFFRILEVRVSLCTYWLIFSPTVLKQAIQAGIGRFIRNLEYVFSLVVVYTHFRCWVAEKPRSKEYKFLENVPQATYIEVVRQNRHMMLRTLHYTTFS